VIAAVSMSYIERSLTVLSKLADQRGAEVARNARDREYKLKNIEQDRLRCQETTNASNSRT
jgi:hypothetical protein